MENPPPPLTQSPDPGGINENQWAVAIHLSALIGLVIPFGNILAPLVIWLVRKEHSPSLDAVGKNVLNFQISWTIYIVLAGLSIFFCVGTFLLPIIGIVWLVFVIIGAIKAGNGESYNFPLTIKML